MTTVAYTGSMLVCDSLATDGNAVVDSEVNKIHTLKDGSTLIGAGNWSDIYAVIEWVNGGCIKSERPELEANIQILHITSDGDFIYDSKKLIRTPAITPVFMGSGYEMAKGAYDVCKCPIQAVEVACKFDVYSGGDINVRAFGEKNV